MKAETDAALHPQSFNGDDIGTSTESQTDSKSGLSAKSFSAAHSPQNRSHKEKCGGQTHGCSNCADHMPTKHERTFHEKGKYKLQRRQQRESGAQVELPESGSVRAKTDAANPVHQRRPKQKNPQNAKEMKHSKSDTGSATETEYSISCATIVTAKKAAKSAATDVTKSKHQAGDDAVAKESKLPNPNTTSLTETKHLMTCATGFTESKHSTSRGSIRRVADHHVHNASDNEYQHTPFSNQSKQPKQYAGDMIERPNETDTAINKQSIARPSDETEYNNPTIQTTHMKGNNRHSPDVVGRAETSHSKPNARDTTHTNQCIPEITDSPNYEHCKLKSGSEDSKYSNCNEEGETRSKKKEFDGTRTKFKNLDKNDCGSDNKDSDSDHRKPPKAHASGRTWTLSLHLMPRNTKKRHRHKKTTSSQDSSSDSQAESKPTYSDKKSKQQMEKQENVMSCYNTPDEDKEDKEKKHAIDTDADDVLKEKKKGKNEAFKTDSKKLDSTDGFGHHKNTVDKETFVSKDQVRENATSATNKDIQHYQGLDAGHNRHGHPYEAQKVAKDKEVSTKDISKIGKDVDINAQNLGNSTRERTKRDYEKRKSLQGEPRNIPNDGDTVKETKEVGTGKHTSARGTPAQNGLNNSSSTQEGKGACREPNTGHKPAKSLASDYQPSKPVVASEEKRTVGQFKTETLLQQNDAYSKAPFGGATSKISQDTITTSRKSGMTTTTKQLEGTQFVAPEECTNSTLEQINAKVKAEPENTAHVVQQKSVETEVRQQDKEQVDRAEIREPESLCIDLAHSAQQKEQQQRKRQSEKRLPSQSQNQISNTEKVNPELPLPKEKPEVVQGDQQKLKASTTNNGQKDVVQMKSKQPTEDTSSEKSRGPVSKGIPLSHSPSEHETGRQDSAASRRDNAASRQDNAASEKASSSKEHRQSQHQRNQASSQQPAAPTSKKAVKPNKENGKTPSPKQALERKIRDFMLQHFPRLHDWTYIVPPITFNVAKRTPDARLRGCFRSELTPQSNVRADEAKERILKCLQELSQHKTQFIMSGVIFDEYLNQRPSQSSERPGEKVQMPFPKPTDLPPQYRRGEIDVMIIDKSYGILILGVKAIGDTFNEMSVNESQRLDLIRKVLEKVLVLIRKEREVILHLVGDIPCTIPVSAMLVLPNLSRSLLKETLESFPDLRKELTTLLKTQRPVEEVCLCAEDLPAKHQAMTDDEARHFVQCWIQQFPNRPQIIDNVVYEQIIGRFCGPFSSVTVWTAEPTRTDVRTLGKAVSETGRRFSTTVLLPQHIEVLDSEDKYVYISGIPGAGKTLVLTLKGLHWVHSGFYVCVLTVRAGQSPVALTVKERIQNSLDLEADTRGQGVIDTDSIYKDNNDPLQINCKRLVKRLTQRADGRPVCLLLDEIHGELQRAIYNIRCQLPQHSRFWCTGLWDTACPQGFVQKQLKISIRCPPAVQDVLQLSEPSSNMSMASPTSFPYVTFSTQMAERPLPTTGVRPKLISHARSGITILDCTLCGKTLAAYLKEELSIGADLFLHDILILTADTDTLSNTHNMYSSNFVDTLRKEGLEVNIITSLYQRELAFPAENKITLTSYKFVAGLERKVVVFLPKGTPSVAGTNLSKVSFDTDNDTDEDDTTLDPVSTSWSSVSISSPETRVNTTGLNERVSVVVDGSSSSQSDVIMPNDDVDEKDTTPKKLLSEMPDRRDTYCHKEDFFHLRDDLIIENGSDVEDDDDDGDDDDDDDDDDDTVLGDAVEVNNEDSIRSYDSRLREAVSQLSETNRERLWFAASRAVAHVVVFHFADN